MFQSISITTLDLSNFNTNKVTNITEMFKNANNLTEIYLNNANFDNVTDKTNVFINVPASVSIYVKDENAKNFILSIRSDLTNVRVSEESVNN